MTVTVLYGPVRIGDGGGRLLRSCGWWGSSWRPRRSLQRSRAGTTFIQTSAWRRQARPAPLDLWAPGGGSWRMSLRSRGENSDHGQDWTTLTLFCHWY